MTSPYAELVEAVLTRARIRRSNTERKSVQEGRPDRMADQLEAAAAAITDLEAELARAQAIAETTRKAANEAANLGRAVAIEECAKLADEAARRGRRDGYTVSWVESAEALAASIRALVKDTEVISTPKMSDNSPAPQRTEFDQAHYERTGEIPVNLPWPRGGEAAAEEEVGTVSGN